MFGVVYSDQARRFLKQSTATLRKRLFRRIDRLRAEPIERDAKRVVGFSEKLLRVRVGQYRLLYEVDQARRVLGIVKIDKRSRAYR